MSLPKDIYPYVLCTNSHYCYGHLMLFPLFLHFMWNSQMATISFSCNCIDDHMRVKFREYRKETLIEKSRRQGMQIFKLHFESKSKWHCTSCWWIDPAGPVMAAADIRSHAIQPSNCCCHWGSQFQICFNSCNLRLRVLGVETERSYAYNQGDF